MACGDDFALPHRHEVKGQMVPSPSGRELSARRTKRMAIALALPLTPALSRREKGTIASSPPTTRHLPTPPIFTRRLTGIGTVYRPRRPIHANTMWCQTPHRMCPACRLWRNTSSLVRTAPIPWAWHTPSAARPPGRRPHGGAARPGSVMPAPPASERLGAGRTVAPRGPGIGRQGSRADTGEAPPTGSSARWFRRRRTCPRGPRDAGPRNRRRFPGGVVHLVSHRAGPAQLRLRRGLDGVVGPGRPARAMDDRHPHRPGRATGPLGWAGLRGLDQLWAMFTSRRSP